MQTHEQYVGLEVAKLAKQAGFDWKVGAYFIYGEFHRAGFYENYNTCILADYRTISAPTQSVLQRWLREVKGIQVWSEFHNQIAKIKSGWIVCFGFFSDNYVEVDYLSGYPTYEAALEAGLKQCLTLLIEKLYPNLKGGEK